MFGDDYSSSSGGYSQSSIHHTSDDEDYDDYGDMDHNSDDNLGERALGQIA